jgi:hypothetical protein
MISFAIVSMMMLFNLDEINCFDSCDFHNVHDVDTLLQLENDKMQQQVVFHEAYQSRNIYRPPFVKSSRIDMFA